MSKSGDDRAVSSLEQLIDSAVAIALVTGACYVAGFCYDSAYLREFGIPHTLAQVDLRSILLHGAGVVFLTAISYLAIHVAFARAQDRSEISTLDWLWFAGRLGILIVLAAGLHFYFQSLTVTILLAVTTLAIVMLDTIPWLQWSRLRVALSQYRRNRPLRLRLLVPLPPREIVGACLMAYMSAASAILIGQQKARTQEVFPVFELSGNVECAALRDYGDRIICLELPAKARGNVHLHVPNDDAGKFVMKNVGRVATGLRM